MIEKRPPGWTEAAIREAAILNPKHSGTLDPALPVSFVPMPCVSDSQPDLLRTEDRPLSAVRKGYTHFADGDVLFAKITPCMENGKGAVARRLRNGLGCGSTELHVLRPTEAIDPYYLYHYLHQQRVRQEAAENFTGSAGQLRVPVTFVAEHVLPLPPLAEQQRIVAVLDAVLAKVASCQVRLARVPTLLRRFRQAVLAAACSGRLTADWRNGRGVKRNGAEYPPTWNKTTIDGVAECLDRFRKPINRDQRSSRIGSIPYYGANGQVGWIDTHLFDEDLVLVVEDESFVGRVKPFSYVIRGKSWVNNHAHVLRPRAGMPADYLNLHLSFYDFVPLTSGTTGRRKLNQKSLMDAPLTVAPLAEQQEIVRRVDALFAVVNQIEARYEHACRHVDRLAQSVLAKAFRGGLVPTEHALAAAEGREYESADQLLARIRDNSSPQPKFRSPRKRSTT